MFLCAILYYMCISCMCKCTHPLHLVLHVYMYRPVHSVLQHTHRIRIDYGRLYIPTWNNCCTWSPTKILRHWDRFLICRCNLLSDYIIPPCPSLTIAGASLPSGNAGISVPPHLAAWRRPPPGPRRLWNETLVKRRRWDSLHPRHQYSDYNTGIKMIDKWIEEPCHYTNSLNVLHYPLVGYVTQGSVLIWKFSKGSRFPHT